MVRKNNSDPKDLALRQQGSLNSHPDHVSDELFRTNDFFDPRDLVQVKYEMLRRVQNDGQPVSRSAAGFGFSRPSFYQAQAAFQQGGLSALMPQKRGPKEAHKITAEVLAFVRQARQEDPSLRPADLAERVRDRYGVSVHPRSIERAHWCAAKKNRGERNFTPCHWQRGFCRALRAAALRRAGHDRRSQRRTRALPPSGNGGLGARWLVLHPSTGQGRGPAHSQHPLAR